MIEPMNSFNIFNFERLDRDFPSYQPSVREIEVTSRWSDSDHNHENNPNNVESTTSNFSLYDTVKKAVLNIFKGG